MGPQPSVDVIDDRYEVGPVIGRGAMGSVHRGRDRRLGRDVAIKFLPPELATHPEVRARFEAEARAAARLSHAAIVAVFDSGEWEGSPFLVMECLPGRTLADEIAAGPLPADRVRDVALDAAGALDAAHQRGVIHRDVKPGNILLTDTGRLKLADFGIAKSTESLDHTVTGTIVGTPAYLAPERLTGAPATARTDLYSLGVVLYEALAGAKPFLGETPIALAHAIHTVTPTPISERVPGVDADLAAVIDRMMAKDPADRPTSAAAVVHALSIPTDLDAPTTVLPVPIATQPPNPVPAWWRSRSQGERQAIGAAVVALVAVVLLVLVPSVWGDDDGPPLTTVPTSTPSEPVPQPLDDAVRRLEDAVQP